MKNKQDYYRILHVHPNADITIIRASYRTLMQKLKYHPDLGGDAEEAALINEAYAILSNPALRADYDLHFSVANHTNKKSASHKKRSRKTESGPRKSKATRSNTKTEPAKTKNPKTKTQPHQTQPHGSKPHGSKQADTNTAKPKHSPHPKGNEPTAGAARSFRIEQTRYAESHQYTYGPTSNNLNNTDIRQSRCLFCKETNHYHQNPQNRDHLICYNCKSPLQFVNYNPLWIAERRSDRLKTEAPINFSVNTAQSKSFQAQVTDLSPTGMGIKSKYALKVGDILKIHNDELSAVACVIRTKKPWRQKYYFIGIKFLALKINQSRGTFLSQKA